MSFLQLLNYSDFLFKLSFQGLQLNLKYTVYLLSSFIVLGTISSTIFWQKINRYILLSFKAGKEKQVLFKLLKANSCFHLQLLL